MTRFFALTLLLACSGGTDSVTDTGSTDSGEPAVETECDNGADEDGDGSVDCADSDCAGEASCTWPTQIHVDATLYYDANTLAKFGGASDCTTHYTSDMTTQYPNDCATCDRIYTGTFTYVSDDCPMDANTPRPTTGEYGLTFTSAAQWDGSWMNQGAWTSMGPAANDGNDVYVFTSTDEVIYEGTNIGDLYTTFKFSER